MLRVTAPFRMLDQLFDLFRGRGTLQSDGEADIFERRARALQVEFVRDIKGAANIDLPFFDLNFVEMREPRNLCEQSKSRAHEKI